MTLHTAIVVLAVYLCVLTEVSGDSELSVEGRSFSGDKHDVIGVTHKQHPQTTLPVCVCVCVWVEAVCNVRLPFSQSSD